MHKKLINNQWTWLVTGAAGFIGSHIVETLLSYNQRVIGLDNLSACGEKNLIYLNSTLSRVQKNCFKMIKSDIMDPDACDQACDSVDFVLHHAAIGSVPRSFEEPSYVDSVNVGGFLNTLNAAAKNKVKSFIYASSSAVYGDYTEAPNRENQPLRPLSPYAVSKYANELYAKTLSSHYDLKCVGLRYFNIYGSRQDPNGDYAAVIPKWIKAMKDKQDAKIFGDGLSIRDFCHVKDVVQANILAALTPTRAQNAVYNIGSGQRTSLNDLYAKIQEITGYERAPLYQQKRAGDICNSSSDITLAKTDLSFNPSLTLHDGLAETIPSII